VPGLTVLQPQRFLSCFLPLLWQQTRPSTRRAEQRSPQSSMTATLCEAERRLRSGA
ncbi:unnamed protein product, partial [Rangifer tarandus platyrhynchus]